MAKKHVPSVGKAATLWLLRALLAFISLFTAAAVLLSVFPVVGIVLGLVSVIAASVLGLLIPASAKQYYVHASERGVYLSRGIIIRKFTFVPYRSVVAHSIRATPLSRFLRVFTVVLYLAGSKISLRAIPKKDALLIVARTGRHRT